MLSFPSAAQNSYTETELKGCRKSIIPAIIRVCICAQKKGEQAREVGEINRICTLEAACNVI